MRTLLLTYDLVGTDETSADYNRLIERIQAYPNWARPAKSVWVIKTQDSAETVRNALWSLMDPNDRLFVIVCQREAAWMNVLCTNTWLHENL